MGEVSFEKLTGHARREKRGVDRTYLRIHSM